jgi:uncharacterized protein
MTTIPHLAFHSFQFDLRLAALLAVFVAAIISSTVGFAFSALAAGMLLHIMNDKIAAVEIMLISSTAVQMYCVALLWRSIEIARVARLFLGGVLVMPIGIYILLAMDAAIYSVFVGSIVAAYGATTFLRQTPSMQWTSRFAEVAVGAVGGITGPLVAFPGAAAAIWCSARGWDKLTQRSVYQPYILCMQIITFAALAMLGQTNHVDVTDGLFAIPAVLGAHIGFTIFARITDAQFRLLTGIFLVVSGLAILGKALR